MAEMDRREAGIDETEEAIICMANAHTNAILLLAGILVRHGLANKVDIENLGYCFSKAINVAGTPRENQLLQHQIQLVDERLAYLLSIAAPKE